MVTRIIHVIQKIIKYIKDYFYSNTAFNNTYTYSNSSVDSETSSDNENNELNIYDYNVNTLRFSNISSTRRYNRVEFSLYIRDTNIFTQINIPLYEELILPMDSMYKDADIIQACKEYDINNYTHQVYINRNGRYIKYPYRLYIKVLL